MLRSMTTSLAIAFATIIVTVDPVGAAACPLKKSCAGSGTTGGGTPVPFDFRGHGLGDVTGQVITWQRVAMGGSGGVMGPLTVSLDPRAGVTSSGSLSSPTFPTNSQIDFRFAIVARDLSPTCMVSDTPLQLEATGITAIPPTTTYTKVGPPVNFYFLGDATKTTQFTLSSASVQVEPDTASVPALSTWGMAILAALLAVGTAMVVRKRSLARPA